MTPPDKAGTFDLLPDEPFEFAPEGEGDAELAGAVEQGIREMGADLALRRTAPRQASALRTTAVQIERESEEDPTISG